MPPADPYSNSHHTPVGRVVADFVGVASAPARPQGSQAPFPPDGHFNYEALPDFAVSYKLFRWLFVAFVVVKAWQMSVCICRQSVCICLPRAASVLCRSFLAVTN